MDLSYCKEISDELRGEFSAQNVSEILLNAGSNILKVKKAEIKIKIRAAQKDLEAANTYEDFLKAKGKIQGLRASLSLF